SPYPSGDPASILRLHQKCYRTWTVPLTSSEQAAQKRDQLGADEDHTTAGHKLLHALALCRGVVGPITFQQVDNAPDTETGTDGDHQGLENGDSRAKEFHNIFDRNIWRG